MLLCELLSSALTPSLSIAWQFVMSRVSRFVRFCTSAKADVFVIRSKPAMKSSRTDNATQLSDLDANANTPASVINVQYETSSVVKFESSDADAVDTDDDDDAVRIWRQALSICLHAESRKVVRCLSLLMTMTSSSVSVAWLKSRSCRRVRFDKHALSGVGESGGSVFSDHAPMSESCWSREAQTAPRLSRNAYNSNGSSAPTLSASDFR